VKKPSSKKKKPAPKPTKPKPVKLTIKKANVVHGTLCYRELLKERGEFCGCVSGHILAALGVLPSLMFECETVEEVDSYDLDETIDPLLPWIERVYGLSDARKFPQLKTYLRKHGFDVRFV